MKRNSVLVNSFTWDFWSKLLIAIFLTLQLVRWRVLPQFMDIYYHLLTAVGFIQAGGYSGWDFWQYAPGGRIHLYPPIFHIILAFLIKLGINQVILAKVSESIIPVLFLFVEWYVARKNFNDIFACLVLLVSASSFSFFSSLTNHLPATLAIIFGILAVNQFFLGRSIRAGVFLALAFYTHIGISWFFVISFIIYGLLSKETRKICAFSVLVSICLASPMLIKELNALSYIKTLGINLNERYLCQIKVLDYIMAFLGILFLLKSGQKKFMLFLGLFLSSLIFVIYPYRFFSAEGFLPVIFLEASFLYFLYKKYNKKYIIALSAIFYLFVSPTLSLEKLPGQEKITYKLNFSDSALLGMLFAKGQSMWRPEYILTARLIKENTEQGDIIYSTTDFVGVCLASLTGRSTANALLTEIKPTRGFDPFLVSKAVVFDRLDEEAGLEKIVSYYNLKRIGENKLFILYINPAGLKANIKKASITFPLIWLVIFAGFLTLFLKEVKITQR